MRAGGAARIGEKSGAEKSRLAYMRLARNSECRKGYMRATEAGAGRGVQRVGHKGGAPTWHVTDRPRGKLNAGKRT